MRSLARALLIFSFASLVPAHAEHDPQHRPGDATAAEGGLLSLLEKLGGNLRGAGGGEFLHPEVAYVLSARALDAHTVVARWTIARGYYLYRKRFKFALERPAGVALGAAALPPGEVKTDQFFGEMEVYYQQVEATIPVQRTARGATEIVLNIGYQGCADAGLCYPPITKSVVLALPAVASEAGGGGSPPGLVRAALPAGRLASGAPDGDLALSDRIAVSLVNESLWLVLLSFFGFGLLLTFTPCVFPMVPILASIIAGQGERVTTRAAFSLSLVYVLAMALTYTAAGVLAGLFGGNLPATFQAPWILVAFSGVFVLLALSMFGFYDLQVPAAWHARLTALSRRQQGGTYLGVAVMGFLSALIIGPCVAAPLAGALIYIGQTGDAQLGGVALFALSMGMGTPVLVAGTSAGKLLPRSGAWMNTVKVIFGVLLLAVAIYLLERIIPGWTALLLWAALLIVSAIYMGALDALQAGAGGWRRLWKGAGLVMMVYGVLLMVGAAGGGSDALQPLRGVAGWSAGGKQARGLPFKPVKGVAGLNAELRLAAAQGKPVMLDYYADWCVSCKQTERYTFSDAGVQQALAQVVLLQTDVTANDDQDRALLRQFGLYGPPAILFFGPDGRERRRYRVLGYVDAETFRTHVERATRVL